MVGNGSVRVWATGLPSVMRRMPSAFPETLKRASPEMTDSGNPSHTADDVCHFADFTASRARNATAMTASDRNNPDKRDMDDDVMIPPDAIP